jgi:thiol-disulfide isomerase/thioredoxin
MKRFLIILGVVLSLTIFGLLQLFVFGQQTAATTPKGVSLGDRYVEIASPSGFVNTEGTPVQIADYIGKKIILIEFMTYTCVNCQRTFPYIVRWYETYKDKGLMVIGIHTPEFAFEKEMDNVEKAMAKSKITFPVVLDNDYSTWNAYGNRFWPRRYLIDLNGEIVYDHSGEGEYEETEQKIKELLGI